MSRAWLGPVGLFLLQSAPVAVVPDSNGHRHLAFGASAGSYLDRTVSCDGNVISERRVGITAAGAEGGIPIGGMSRVIANAGFVSAHADDDDAANFSGAYAGAMVTYEGRKSGMGIGLESQPGPGATYLPEEYGYRLPRRLTVLAFARIGREDGTALRIEAGGPAAPGTPPDLFRVGIAHRWGATTGTGYRFDVGSSDFPVGGGGSIQAQVRIPSSNRFGVTLVGQFRAPYGGNVGVSGMWRW